jgi:hypothetical protein
MADPTQTNISQTSIPDYAKPYVENLLGAAQATAFKTDEKGNIIGMQPYQTYPGQRTADFTGMQQQAFQGAQNLGPSSQLNTATNMAQQAGQNALNTQYNPQQYGNAYQGIGAYNPGTFNQQTVSAPNLNNYQMSGPQQVNSQQFTGDQISQYMNPYLQQSLAPQMAELNRAYDITGNQAKGQATQAGAFGGSRQAIMQAENERNRNMGISSLLGQGYNNAYNQAANQFNTSNQQNLQAQMSNQGAGLTAGQANLNALLGVQSLGAGQNLAAQQANQQTNLATQQAQQAANQYGYGQQAINAQNQAQYGQAANQLNAQQQQFGAGLGLQGQQTALTAAGALGNLGGTQFNQQTQALGLQNQLGGQQQAQQQGILNQQYQDFLSQKQYPYQQMGFMSDMLRGLPLSQTANTMYQAPPTTAQNIAAIGAGAYGVSKLIAKGGQVKSFSLGGSVPGGSVMSREFKENAVNNIPDDRALQLAQANAAQRSDFDTQMAAQQKLAEDAAMRRGIPSAMPNQFANNVVRAARGGILSFKEPTEQNNYGVTSSDDSTENDNTETNSNDNTDSAYGIDVRNRVLKDYFNSQDRLARGPRYTAPTREQTREAEKAGLAELREAAGPDIYGPEQTRLDREDADRIKNLEQGKGLAALGSISAILKPGGTARGLAEGAGAFGGLYGEALKADRAEKQYLGKARFAMADAKRKENLGMFAEARKDVQNAQTNQYNAAKAADQRDSIVGSNAAKMANALRVNKTGSGEAKPNPTIWSTQQLAARIKQEHQDWTPEQVNAEAVTQFNQQTKGQGAVTKTYGDARKDYKSYMTLNGTKVKKIIADQFNGDEEAFKEDYISRYMQGLPTDIYTPKGKKVTQSNPAVGGGGTAPPLPPGFAPVNPR